MPLFITSLSVGILTIVEMLAVKFKEDACVTDMQESESKNKKDIQGGRDEKREKDRLAVMTKTMNNLNFKECGWMLAVDANIPVKESERVQREKNTTLSPVSLHPYMSC